MIIKLKPKDNLFVLHGQAYLERECDGSCLQTAEDVCLGKAIASVNWWNELGPEQCEFRYWIDRRMISAVSGHPLHPGIDITKYCHRKVK